MNERKKILALTLMIMTCVMVVGGAVSLTILYRAACERERERLVETVQSRARLIEAVAQFDAVYSTTDLPGGPEEATLGQIARAHEQFRGFGDTGEFTLAKRVGEEIVFLLRHRHSDLDHPRPVSIASELAEPMRRALSGQSGTVIGLDYRGERVLAAYEPVGVVGWGVVCKIDLSEIRSEFVRAGFTVALAGFLVIVAGAALLLRSANPLIKRFEISEASLVEAQRIARMGSWNWNIETNELKWSDEIYRIFGRRPAEFEATYEAFLATVHPEDREFVREHVDAALEDNAEYSIDHRIVLPGGEVRYVHEQAEVTRDSSGTPSRMAGTVIDITGRREAEAALRESKAFLQTVIDGIPASILVIDREYRVLFANQAARQITGLPQAIPGETRCYAISHGRDIPCDGTECSCPLKTAMETKAPATATHTHVDQDGNESIVELIAAPIFDSNGKVVHIVESCRDVTARNVAEAKLKEAFTEIMQLKDRLEAENVVLREEIRVEHVHEEIVGNSPAIKAVLGQVEQVGPTDSAALLIGETGTGKELIAHAIHAMSARKQRIMVHVNCAALPPTLVESELFGREKGAYTGALSKQVGRFEVADQSTIFLDEIGELPLESQGKLLRVLQEGQFERLGSSRTTTVDVRVIAATNRDLSLEVRAGRFREDLFYRLNVFPILVPPLRQRLDDIPQLVWTFVDEFAREMGKKIEAIPNASMQALQRYSWPGNVRELRNVIERAMIANTGPTLQMPVPGAAESPEHMDMRLEQVEREHIETVLRMVDWRVRGTSGAAEILGLKPTTLEARMAKLGITRPPRDSNIS